MIPYESESIVLKELYDYGRKHYALIIPEYQRSYLWKEENFEKLIDSLLENFSSLGSISTKTFYLGAIIFSKPKYKELRTLQSYDIVDGQQRITSLCLLIIILYRSICYQQNKFISDTENNLTDFDLINKEINTTLELMKEFLFVQEDIRSNQGKIEYFMPRIIRQNDRRTTEIRNQRYESSISQVLENFKNSLPDQMEKSVIPKNEKIDTKTIINALKYFEKEIDTINLNVDTSEKETKYTYVPFPKLNKNQYINLLENQSIAVDSFKTKNQKRLFRLLLIANFLFKKTAISLIQCTEPNDAYDIFDTLNTSGLPLTALETLKPQIVLYYQNRDIPFDNSEVQTHFNLIDDYLDEFYEDTNKRHKETKKIIVATALLIKGEKLSESLTLQRNFISKLQKEFEKKELSDKLVEYISYLTEYRAFFFNRKSFAVKLDSHLNTIPIEDNDFDIVKLLSSLFVESNTHLVVPLLTRYYIYSKINENFEPFISFIKAIAAFLILRRAVTGRTGGIDNSFREIFKKNKTLGFNGLTLDGNNLDLPDINRVKKVLINQLKNKSLPFDLNDKEKWVNYVSKMPLYNDTRIISRFMILTAYDNSILDTNENGLITNLNAAPNVARNFLSFNAWNEYIYSTIEHIAPETPKHVSDYENVYKETYTKHTLGNLILIPKMLNIYLSNNSWSIKKNIYKAISTSNTNDRRKYLNKAVENGLNLDPKNFNELVSFEKASEILKGLSDFENFDAETVHNRSTRICSLVWDKLIPWIQPEDED